MASISKLAVRGIRAFSPDDDEQVISFHSPLTVIVGNNGCGKTTIIEALQYAVCGSLPPGNRSGQAFVHDPKSVGQSTVKASVKLRFTNRAGSAMAVIRSMELTQKKTTMQFKSLDGTLRARAPSTGENVSMSHKCTELDRQIPTLMGVSRPILEHVIFTHQEDSSWPLQEGAVLKKRFDDIFESSRYAKALEAIRKTRLEYSNVAKNHKVDLASLASHKHAAEGFRDDLDSAMDELANIDERIHQCDEAIEQETEQCAKYEKVLNEMQGLTNRACDLRNEVERDETVASSRRNMLDEDWTDRHTHDQLRAIMAGFDDSIQSDVRRRDDAERASRDAEAEIERMRRTTVELNSRRAVLQAEAEAHHSVVRQRLRLVEGIAEQYELDDVLTLSQRSLGTQLSRVAGDGPSSPGDATTAAGELTAEDMEVIRRAVEAKDAELKKKLTDHRGASHAEEDALQEGLGELLAKIKAVETERNRLAQSRSEAQIELSRISSQHGVGATRIRKSEIEEAKAQAAKFAKDRDELNREPRKSIIPKEIKSCEEKMDSLRRAIEEDSSVLKELRQNAENQTAIDMLRAQLRRDVENVEDLLKEQSFLLTKHGMAPNTAGFGFDSAGIDRVAEEARSLEEKAEAKHGDKSHDLSRTEEEVQAAQKGVSEKGALVGHNRKLLTERKAHAEALGRDDRGVQKIGKIIRALTRYEANMNMAPPEGVEIRQDMDPQNLLKHLSRRIEEHSNDAITAESVRAIIKKLRMMAREVDEDGDTIGIVCPCCRREMTGSELETFSASMKDLADPDTSEIILSTQVSSEKNIAIKRNFERWHGTVQQSVPDYLEYKRTTDDIRSMEKSVAEEEEAFSRFQSDLDAAKERAAELREEVSELRVILDVAKRLRDDSERMLGKKTEIATKEVDLSIAAPSSSGRSMSTVEREMQARMDEKDSLMQSITRLNKELTSINDRISRVTNQAAKAEQMARDKEKRYALEQEASARKTDLNELIVKCQQEEKNLGEQIAPIKQKIRVKEDERQKMRALAKAEEDRINENINQFMAQVQTLHDLTSRIDRYLRFNKARELEQVTKELSDTANQQVEKEKELDEMKPELEKLNKKINDQERHKKTIQGNIELLDLIARIRKKKKELDLLEEEIDAVQGSDTTERDYQAAGKRIQKHKNTKAQYEGRRTEKKDQIKALKRKLQGPEYKNVDEDHRRKMIEYETTKIAVEDLEKYHSALDNALLRYHGMKIADINKTIRELWTLTYKGEDITNIKLVSGQESGSRAARSYNYRVVMTKGNAELDMRGRCSAGQRVLASIVIRLALAETFCLDCGVMCLDEPTTNLDQANKRGLAIALAQIIARRAAQVNFQLVVITHDHDFVNMIKNELSSYVNVSMPDTYYEVLREEGGDGKHYSKIHAIDWEEL